MDTIVATLQDLIGARVQGVSTGERELRLTMYQSHKTTTLVFDLSPGLPVLIIDPRPQKPLKKMKPVGLFLKSKIMNLELDRLQRIESLGRVVALDFKGQGRHLSIEFRMIPHGQNLLVCSDGKSISWSKPKELPSFLIEDEKHVKLSRTFDQLQNEWVSSKKSLVNQKPKDLEKELEKAKAKLEKVVEKLSSEARDYDIEIARCEEIAFSLGEAPTLPEDIRAQLPLPEAHWIQNRELLFEKIKKLKRKRQGLLERMKQVLEQEKNFSVEDLQKSFHKKGHPAAQKMPSGLSFKHLKLEGGKDVLIGKNARENIELLRAAKPWHYWFHLRDYPGSFGILRRNRGQTVTPKEMETVAQWVAKMSFKNKYKSKLGEKLDLVVSECRYVKPIKGDKVGRVTFTNSRPMNITLE